MATIKSFTSLEQSKKLAKILPLESADMRYEYYPIERDDIQKPIIGFSINSLNYYKDSDLIRYLPCWSLAALLSVLPFPLLQKTFTGYRCDSYNKEGTTCKLGESADNPIDACVEMILKLHKQKML